MESALEPEEQWTWRAVWRGSRAVELRACRKGLNFPFCVPVFVRGFFYHKAYIQITSYLARQAA